MTAKFIGAVAGISIERVQGAVSIQSGSFAVLVPERHFDAFYGMFRAACHVTFGPAPVKRKEIKPGEYFKTPEVGVAMKALSGRCLGPTGTLNQCHDSGTVSWIDPEALVYRCKDFSGAPLED